MISFRDVATHGERLQPSTNVDLPNPIHFNHSTTSTPETIPTSSITQNPDSISASPSVAPNTVNDGSANPVPSVIISLLFNESPEWLQYWLRQAAAAFRVPYCVVVATSSTARFEDVARRHRELEGGCVVFSPPARRSKFGYDLLRGHISNLKVAFNEKLPPFADSSRKRDSEPTNDVFTHVVLMASNIVFIRKVTRQWISDVVARGTSPLAGRCGGGCGTPTGFARVHPGWVWTPAVLRDDLFWAAVNATGRSDVETAQVEGVFGPRLGFEAILKALTSESSPWARLVASQPVEPVVESPPQTNLYPAEEILPRMLAIALGVDTHFRGVVRVFWYPFGPYPTEQAVLEAKANSWEIFGIKWVHRDPQDSLVKFCWDLASRD
eukprot:c1720_g1_i1.p1 GENE.c1720_g1_i1~~c1720_g1_i1.p1  ORF type:complete len:424 (+),score=42.68 c1720_g1_i1:128-1273(+)